MKISFGAAVTSPFYLQDRERYLRAELLNEAGRVDEAIGWYTAVLASRAHPTANAFQFSSYPKCQ